MNFLTYPVIQNFVLPGIDIILVTIFIYQIYKLLEGSRAIQIAKGVGIILVIFLAAKFLNLITLKWLLTYILNYGALVLIILFQPEIRKLLIKFGKGNYLKGFDPEEKNYIIREITEAVKYCQSKKIGLLLVLKENDFLKNVTSTGISLNATLNSKIIISLSHKKSMIHDGAIIIDGKKIISVGAILPLSENIAIDKKLGTRHRAALGLSEESDAFIIVVSEERKTISVAKSGTLTKINLAKLKILLNQIFLTKEEYAKKRKKRKK